MKEIAEIVARSEEPQGVAREMLTPRDCWSCLSGRERDVTYRFVRGDGRTIIELCPRCMAKSLLPGVLEADAE